ncbi:MAG: preprotein translocase subunit SecE [Chloroflexota bacterium]
MKPQPRTGKEGRTTTPNAPETKRGGRLVFFGETWSEFKKVVWPSRREALRLTTIVIALTVALGLILGGIDYGFTRLINFFGGAG